jgi:signal peptidase I
MSVAQKTEKKAGGLGETVSVIFQALILALIIRTLFFQPFSIPSGSMRPTLLEGDYLFVTKWAYGYSRHSLPFSPPIFSGRIWGAAPERGDVVVFKFPPNPDRLHQACDRSARRPHPDESRSAFHQWPGYPA